MLRTYVHSVLMVPEWVIGSCYNVHAKTVSLGFVARALFFLVPDDCATSANVNAHQLFFFV